MSQTTERRPRVRALPPYKNVDNYRNNSKMSASILVKVDEHIAGLQKLIRRNPSWQTPLNVASILLWRFDQRLKDIEARARILRRAIELRDIERVLLELSAISTLAGSGRRDGHHGIAVSHDLARQGIKEFIEPK